MTQKPTDMPLPLDMEHDGTTSRQTGLFDHGKEQRHSSLPALDDLRTIASSSREAAPSPLKADGSVTQGDVDMPIGGAGDVDESTRLSPKRSKKFKTSDEIVVPRERTRSKSRLTAFQ